ncbi:uncharacterized protein LAJ45_06020 [Morchella importuna]|uniref:Thioesterase/thiol ester dehydrase-isomerase n=1 Tax=Morchella conica CCBAS932 TaxID=1392247 RepID=A0A3N4L014_9PEZI|nr:uncharacterized protein LAJ45_06020 [Morchella importuna]KAH8149868.1 hypothetical protein LAJ45_06020 [Morchella importuna]RPB16136.1 hypothetical protein P167DRAFT_570848 [Morchella conica CCBAS932]
MFKSLLRPLNRYPVRMVTRSHHLYSRSFPLIHEFISPQPSYLLNLTLAPHLSTPPLPTQLPTSGELPPGHHMVYFPPQLPESELLPDGSDASQNPGPEWVRRMWAGGSVHFHPTKKMELMDHAVLQEKVVDLQTRGKPGSKDERMFVYFERSMWSGKQPLQPSDLIEGEAAVVENRCLVFFRGAKDETAVARVVKPPHEADFSLTFMPTQHLLFRFSALTFNAHKIHFDPLFTQHKEKYPGLLCHGPMSLVLLLELLRVNVLDTGNDRTWRVKQFDYRCLAPMYVDQPYKICGRKISDKTYELWAETPQGGYSVKGMAMLEEETS